MKFSAIILAFLALQASSAFASDMDTVALANASNDIKTYAKLAIKAGVTKPVTICYALGAMLTPMKTVREMVQPGNPIESAPIKVPALVEKGRELWDAQINSSFCLSSTPVIPGDLVSQLERVRTVAAETENLALKQFLE